MPAPLYVQRNNPLLPPPHFHLPLIPKPRSPYFPFPFPESSPLAYVCTSLSHSVEMRQSSTLLPSSKSSKPRRGGGRKSCFLLPFPLAVAAGPRRRRGGPPSYATRERERVPPPPLQTKYERERRRETSRTIRHLPLPPPCLLLSRVKPHRRPPLTLTLLPGGASQLGGFGSCLCPSVRAAAEDERGRGGMPPPPEDHGFGVRKDGHVNPPLRKDQ